MVCRTLLPLHRHWVHAIVTKTEVRLYFEYGHRETDYLSRRDKRLGSAIERIGHIHREVNPDLFSSIVHHIVGQQISVRAQTTIWNRLVDLIVDVNSDTIRSLGATALQRIGITHKKSSYIISFAEAVIQGELDLDALPGMSDKEVISKLSALNGIGIWTAEMILLFCMQRPDIMSYGDLAIHRGLRMLYHHKHIDKERFAKYAARYSPYGSVASLYLWAISGGAIPELSDGKVN